MNVACPTCSSHYVLPPALLGPDGARIHCPACGHPFVVSSEGLVSIGRLATDAMTDPTPYASPLSRPPMPEPERDLPPPVEWTRSLEQRLAAERRLAGEGGLAVEVARPQPVAAAPGRRAHEALRAIDDPPGSLRRATAHGVLFSHFGPALVEAYERGRDQGGEAACDEFRRALTESTGIDLTPPPGDSA